MKLTAALLYMVSCSLVSPEMFWIINIMDMFEYLISFPVYLHSETVFSALCRWVFDGLWDR